MTQTITYSLDQLKAAFDLLVQDDYPPDWFRKDDQCTKSWLSDQLSGCEDAMPPDICRELELPPGATYAEGIRVETENQKFAAGLVEQDMNEEAAQEAALAIKLIHDRDEDGELNPLEEEEVREMAADNLRYKAAVLEKAADLLIPETE